MWPYIFVGLQVNNFFFLIQENHDKSPVNEKVKNKITRLSTSSE